MSSSETDSDSGNTQSRSPFSPLKIGFYRGIFIASIFANMGLLIQGVGAAWKMTEMAGAAMVALVQTASFLPTLLFAVPAGAISDVYDRRKVQIFALVFSSLSAAGMTVLAVSGMLTPWLLLILCFCVGTGMTVFAPSLQASIREQVPKAVLPQAIALNSAGFNVARSIGPAIGGFLIVGLGVAWTFGTNAAFYLPMIFVLLLWKYKSPNRGRDTNVRSAIASGLRYVITTPRAYTPIIRVFIFGALGSSVPAILPVFVREILGGSADQYGFMLGAFGIGAVIGVLSLSFWAKYSREFVVGTLTLILAIAIVCLSMSPFISIALAAVFVIGAAWTMVATTFTTVLQIGAPPTVTGRVVSIFQASFSGGVALGSFIWGVVATQLGADHAFQLSATLTVLSLALSWLIPLANNAELNRCEDSQ